jgi:hypothetical protein
MDNVIDHMGHVITGLNKYWHIVLGIGATFVGAIKLHSHMLGKQYATKEELRNCHDKLYDAINSNRETNTQEHTAIRDLMIKLHSKDHE